MFDRVKFKIALVESGHTVRDVAKALGVSTATVYRKMNGTSDFFRDEIQKISQLCGRDNMNDVFFA